MDAYSFFFGHLLLRSGVIELGKARIVCTHIALSQYPCGFAGGLTLCPQSISAWTVPLQADTFRVYCTFTSL